MAGQLLAQCGMEEQYSANLLLAVLWASLANTIPAAFWSLAFLLLPEQDGWRQAVISACTPALPDEATGLPKEASSAGPTADELIVQVPCFSLLLRPQGYGPCELPSRSPFLPFLPLLVVGTEGAMARCKAPLYMCGIIPFLYTCGTFLVSTPAVHALSLPLQRVP